LLRWESIYNGWFVGSMAALESATKELFKNECNELISMNKHKPKAFVVTGSVRNGEQVLKARLLRNFSEIKYPKIVASTSPYRPEFTQEVSAQFTIFEFVKATIAAEFPSWKYEIHGISFSNTTADPLTFMLPEALTSALTSSNSLVQIPPIKCLVALGNEQENEDAIILLIELWCKLFKVEERRYFRLIENEAREDIHVKEILQLCK